jgi:starch phosphorylase
MPIVGIGLLYQQGYFRRVIDAGGNQMEFYPCKVFYLLNIT